MLLRRWVLACCLVVGASGCRPKPHPIPCPLTVDEYGHEACIEDCRVEFPDESSVVCDADDLCCLGCRGVESYLYAFEETGCARNQEPGPIYPIGDPDCQAAYEACRQACVDEHFPDEDGCGVSAGLCIEACYLPGYDSAVSCWGRSGDD